MFYINNKGSHNKFWTYTLDEQNFEVCISWGRLGTKGQSKAYKFSGRWPALDFIESKKREKTRKGYSISEEEEFNLEQVRANLVGAGCKIEILKFVKFAASEPIFSLISEESILANPNTIPTIFCRLQFRKGTIKTENSSFDIFISEDKVELIKAEQCMSLRTLSPMSYSYARIKIIDQFDCKFNKIYEITPKLVQALVTTKS